MLSPVPTPVTILPTIICATVLAVAWRMPPTMTMMQPSTIVLRLPMMSPTKKPLIAPVKHPARVQMSKSPRKASGGAHRGCTLR